MENEAGGENRHSLVDAIKKKYEEGQTEEEDSFIQIYVPKKGPGAQAQGTQFPVLIFFQSRREKTNVLHMRKQRRRSASR